MVAGAHDIAEVEEHEEGELPQGWAWASIGTSTDPVQKVDPTLAPTREFVYLDISSIDNARNRITEPKHYKGADAPSRARQLVHFGDTLFSTVRTYLRNIAQVPEIYNQQIASTGFCVLRAKQQVSPKYLFYYCLTDGFITAVSKFQRGVSYPAVRDDDVRRQNIPLPPLPEQHRIVAKIEELFTQLDAGVTALKRVKANLRRYRAAVLKAACEGRLVPQDPGDEPASQLLQRILIERRARWEYSLRAKGIKSAKVKYEEPAPPDVEGLGELPEGWIWANVCQLAENIEYGHTESAREQAIGPKFLRITDIQDGRVNWSTVPYCVCSDIEHIKYRLEDGDIVFARTGATTGKSFLITNPPDAVFASYLIRLRIGVHVVKGYFAAFLDSPMYWAQIMTVRKGSAQPGVNATILATLRVPLPPLAEQHRIVAEVERRLSVVQEVEETVEANLKRAERLRQAVLKRAFRGELVAQEAGEGDAVVGLERVLGEKVEGSKQKAEQLRMAGM